MEHSGRRWGVLPAVSAVAALETFVFGVLIVGDAGFASDEAIHVGAAIGMTTLLVGSIIALPSRRLGAAAAAQALAVAVAILLAAAIVGDPDNVGGQAGPFDPVFAIVVAPILGLAAWRLRHARCGAGPDPALSLVVVALVAAVPLGWYGLEAALEQRNSFPPVSDPHHNGHWLAVALMAFALPLTGLAAAFRLRGWRLMAGAVAATGAGFGIAAMVWPTASSSVGFVRGALLVAGSALFATLAWRAGGPSGPRAPEMTAAAPKSAAHQQ